MGQRTNKNQIYHSNSKKRQKWKWAEHTVGRIVKWYPLTNVGRRREQNNHGGKERIYEKPFFYSWLTSVFVDTDDIVFNIL